MKFRKILLAGVLFLAVLVLGFVLWASAALGPEPEAFAALDNLPPDEIRRQRREKYMAIGRTL